MENLPVVLVAITSEYLQIADIFSLLHINKSFNSFWKSMEYWSIICKGRGNYIKLLSDESKLALYELKESNSNEYGINSTVENYRNSKCFELKSNSLSNFQNLGDLSRIFTLLSLMTDRQFGKFLSKRNFIV